MTSSGPQPRTVAGRYRLHSVLGRGSMGTVWAAYDDFLHRPVAVKEVRLPPGFPAAEATELAERALREARAIASLSHPNVITLHDVVREEGQPFVVMELLNSRSLAGIVNDNGPLDTAQAAAVGDALAAALETAHGAGITHRDVKPANVLVSADGRIKLTDFGIARNVSDATLSTTGLMLGSPAYMAPEVASGTTASPAADLWGLGATLFAVTEGAPPYDADGDPLATASAVVQEEVPAPSPGPLADLISSLMSKDPDRRPRPGEVREALQDYRPPAGEALFPAELFDGYGPAETEPEPPAKRRRADEESEEGGTAPLASDPGPLPFAPTGPRPDRTRRERGPAATALLTALAVVLFAAAGAAGFSLARYVGGVDVLPRSDASGAPPASEQELRLRDQRGDATMLKGDEGGKFSIKVPHGWSRFVTQQPATGVPARTLVQFVSPDGKRSLEVRRFPSYFGDADLDDYLAALRQNWHPDDFVLVEKEPLPDAAGTHLTYRTVETYRRAKGSGSTGQQDSRVLGRTTFARLVRHDQSLWVVSVTVPTEQENHGRTRLFDRVAPTFERR